MSEQTENKLHEVFTFFGKDGPFTEVTQIKTGHINQTFLVRVEGKPYIVQEINTYVFQKPVELMDNILRVTSHIRRKIQAQGGDTNREVLNFLTNAEGKAFYLDGDGHYWRSYEYVDDAVSFNSTEDLSVITDAGRAFGRFQKQLADFPGETLYETIPDFHNTKKRMQNLMEGVRTDTAGRAVLVQNEIKFFFDRTQDASYLVDRIGVDLPLRVTHNDTKFNNILIDNQTGKALCVIDLDTIMPGLAAYDFGDFIRFAASSAAEDEDDLDRVSLCMDRYDAFAKGFVGASDGFFTEAEIESMPWGARIITLETGSRFLLDYLNGDKYFHISDPEQNLRRARTQMKLVTEMERQFAEMQKIIRNYAK